MLCPCSSLVALPIIRLFPKALRRSALAERRAALHRRPELSFAKKAIKKRNYRKKEPRNQRDWVPFTGSALYTDIPIEKIKALSIPVLYHAQCIQVLIALTPPYTHTHTHTLTHTHTPHHPPHLLFSSQHVPRMVLAWVIQAAYGLGFRQPGVPVL